MLNKNPPTIAAIGIAAIVPHMLVVSAPINPAALFKPKKDVTNRTVSGPTLGIIPKKIPKAKPAAILCGVSSSVKKCKKNFLIFCQVVFILLGYILIELHAIDNIYKI